MHRDCCGLRKKRDDEFDFNIGAKIAFERLNTMRNPHIMYGSMDYGEIGKSTKIKDFFNNIKFQQKYITFRDIILRASSSLVGDTNKVLVSYG